jgi:glycosyltransferase involved in cell wall biosynthesis
MVMMKAQLPVSLVSTVWNDLSGCEVFFRQMSAQTKIPAEIIITDAGSRDGTWAFLQAQTTREQPWNLILLQEPGCNVARGRNLAIEQARYETIASTDVGCEWDPEWLEELTTPLFANPQIDMVAGSWAVKFDGLSNPWALTEWAMKGCKHESVALPVTFASSRSIAYRKRLWYEIGGYPEDLTLTGDDTVFGHLMHLHGAKPSAAPSIRCYWHRHETLKSFLKESYRYGIGSGEANIFMRDAALIGGRLALELGCLLTGVIFIALPVIEIQFAGLALFGVGLALFVARAFKLREAVRNLKHLDVDWAWGRVLAFSYLNKIYWLSGSMKGWIYGRNQCCKCRSRLISISPESYKTDQL